ncbi:MAG: alpha/beta hydrolase, partial [Erysipelotrichaceae bacterium]|nr:alpha/beta hydrolase [Erysipelotrichaceae bacterium]
SRGHGKSDKVKEYHYKDMAEDLIAFMRMLNLNDVIFYGFSDGGIIGLLLAMKSERITKLIISGANLKFAGLTKRCRFLIRFLYLFSRDPKLKMMIREPDIDVMDLSQIKAETTVLAGEKDLVSEEETRRIAASIPRAKLRILEGEGHGSYIVHNAKIADLILEELN